MRVEFDGKEYNFEGSKYTVEIKSDRLIVNGEVIATSHSSPNPKDI